MKGFNDGVDRDEEVPVSEGDVLYQGLRVEVGNHSGLYEIHHFQQFHIFNYSLPHLTLNLLLRVEPQLIPLNLLQYTISLICTKQP